MKHKLRKLLSRSIKSISLICLASVLFLALRPEGHFVAAKRPDMEFSPVPEKIKLLTWNILRAKDEAPLGKPWSERKSSYQAILESSAYDVVCLQEALPEQIEFFSGLLPSYDVYRVGREDGVACGEHCPIFFNSQKFSLKESGTFWLSPTPEKPSCSWGENCPRICSWVELQDKASGNAFRVYNIHLHLSPYAQPKAAEVIRAKLADVKVPIILAGDFNAPHKWPALKVFYRQGFMEADAGEALTYHVAGKGIRCLDHILTSNRWQVTNGGVIKSKGGMAYPSDHFGLWADLELTGAKVL